MKRTVFTSIAILLLTGACAAATENLPDDSPMKIVLTGFKEPQPESYLLGEPVTVQFSWENTTDKPLTIASHIGINTSVMRLHIEGDTNSDCDLFSKLIALGYLDDHQVLQPSERIVKFIDVRKMGMVEVGEYEIWLTYDATEIGAEYAGGAVAPINVESNHFRFEIVEPVGIDAQAFEKYANACNEMLDSRGKRERIIAEFPTSSYAGWALLGQAHPIENPSAMLGVFSPRKLPEEPVLRESEQRIRTSRLSLFADNADKLMTFLQARPDFDGANRMRFQIALYQCYIGEFAKAKETLAVVLEEENIQPWLRDQTEVLHAFAKEKSEEKEQR